mgnify:CR=1 FL=1
MSRLRTLGIVAAAVSLGVAAASPAVNAASTVDIHVSILWKSFDAANPRLFDVAGVTPGAGFELTMANQTSNPRPITGAVKVDLDPVAKTITVEMEESDCMNHVDIAITSTEIASLTQLSDNLWTNPNPEKMAGAATSVTGGVAHITWDAVNEDDCIEGMSVGQQAVFSYSSEATAIPATGSNGTLALWGVGLLAAGTVTVAASRRRTA